MDNEHVSWISKSLHLIGTKIKMWKMKVFVKFFYEEAPYRHIIDSKNHKEIIDKYDYLELDKLFGSRNII